MPCIVLQSDGNFALTYAFVPDKGYMPIVKMLLPGSLPADLKNNVQQAHIFHSNTTLTCSVILHQKGCTPFMLAAEYGKLQIIQLILEDKSDDEIEKLCKDTSQVALVLLLEHICP